MTTWPYTIYVSYAKESLRTLTEPLRPNIAYSYIRCGNEPVYDTRTVIETYPANVYPDYLLGYQAWALAADRCTSPYTLLLEYDCRVYPSIHADIYRLIHQEVDIASFQPATIDQVFLREPSHYTSLVLKFMKDRAWDVEEALNGYTVWCPTPAILIRTEVLWTLFHSLAYQDFCKEFKDSEWFAHNLERFISLYVMMQKGKIGSAYGSIVHAMANSHDTVKCGLPGTPEERCKQLL